MTAVRVAIVYGTESGIVRQIIGSNDGIDFGGHVGPGESFVEVDARNFPGILTGNYPDLATAQAIVDAHTGKKAGSSRCVVVANPLGDVSRDGGVVVHVIHADPLIDKIDDHLIIRHDDAQVGWTHDPVKGLAP